MCYAYVTHPSPASFCRLAQPLVTETDPEVLTSAIALSVPAPALALWLALAQRARFPAQREVPASEFEVGQPSLLLVFTTSSVSKSQRCTHLISLVCSYV